MRATAQIPTKSPLSLTLIPEYSSTQFSEIPEIAVAVTFLFLALISDSVQYSWMDVSCWYPLDWGLIFGSDWCWSFSPSYLFFCKFYHHVLKVEWCNMLLDWYNCLFLHSNHRMIPLSHVNPCQHIGGCCLFFPSWIISSMIRKWHIFIILIAFLLRSQGLSLVHLESSFNILCFRKLRVRYQGAFVFSFFCHAWLILFASVVTIYHHFLFAIFLIICKGYCGSQCHWFPILPL